MNKEELIDLINRANAEELIQKVASLEESNRSALATSAKKECNKLIKLIDSDWGKEDYLVELIAARDTELNPNEKNVRDVVGQLANKAMLSVLACCSITDVKRLQYWRFQGDIELVLKLLQDRSPSWLKEWLDSSLAQDYSGVDWYLVSFCIKNKLCERLESDAYIEEMQTGIRKTWGSKDKDSIYQVLRENEWLFEYEIWRIFECDSWCFEKRYDKDLNSSWRHALVKYSSGDPKLQNKLLKAALNGLFVNLKNPVHQGFIHFYKGFDLIESQRKKLESIYYSLLSSSKSFIVGFALDELVALNKTKKLSASDFLLNAKVVFESGAKGQQKKCLKVCEALVKQDSDRLSVFIETLISGLVTENSDTQAQFIDILLSHKDSLNTELVEDIETKRGFIASSLVSKFNELTNVIGSDSITENESSTNQESVGLKLRERVSHYSSDKLALAGLAPIVDLVDGDDAIELYENLLQEHKDPISHKLDRYSTVGQLIEETSSAIEYCDQPEAFEKILDGISRFNLQKGEDFALKTDSIRSRIEKTPSDKGICSLRQGIHDLNKLVLYWVAGHEKIGEDDWYSGRANYGFYSFAAERIVEVSNRVKSGIEAPLLSMPSYSSGILEPQDLIDRIEIYLDAQIAIPKVDFQQAIVRLRLDSDIEVDQRKSPYHQLVAYALGESVELDSTVMEIPSEFKCAAKIRRTYFQEYSGMPEAENNKIDTQDPAKFSEQFKSYIETELSSANLEKLSLNIDLHERTKILKPIENDYLSRWVQRTNFQNSHALWIKLMQISSPNDHGMLIHNAVQDVQALIDKDAIADIQLFALYDCFNDSVGKLSEEAHKLIFLGLVSKNFDTQSAAVEAVVNLVDREKYRASSIVPIAITATNGGIVKQQRLSKALKDIAGASDRHRMWVKHFIDGMINGLDDWPKSFHEVLELLLDLSHDLEMPLNQDVNVKLATIKGSSKLAKAAKSLCKLEFTLVSSKLMQALSESIDIRLKQLNQSARS